MIKFIKEYIKMKKNELRIKNIIYDIIVSIMDEQSDIVELVKKLYITLKDVPADELKSEFIANLARIIHDENSKTIK